MGFLDTLKGMIGGAKPLDPKSQKLHDTLQTALQIVSAFGETLEKPSTEDGLGPLHSEKRLPHPKDRIMWAVGLLQALLASPAGRTEAIRVLKPEEAEYLLSAEFGQALGSAKVLLDMFVPDEALQKQRQLAADIAQVQGSLTTKA